MLSGLVILKTQTEVFATLNNMSDFMEKTILHCDSCGEQLTSFEQSKFNKLSDHWGGKPPSKPMCKSCYWKILEDRKARYGS